MSKTYNITYYKDIDKAYIAMFAQDFKYIYGFKPTKSQIFNYIGYTLILKKYRPPKRPMQDIRRHLTMISVALNKEAYLNFQKLHNKLKELGLDYSVVHINTMVVITACDMMHRQVLKMKRKKIPSIQN